MKYKILFVEDEADLSLIVSDTLGSLGYEVVTAHDGVEGLEKFRSEGADIVIADVMMPRMDGFTMTRAIRKISPGIPLIFLTAKSGIDDVEEGFEAGANDYMRKPFELRELIVRIKALLRRSGSHSTQERLFTIGRYRFDLSTQSLTIGDEVKVLSYFEAKILEILIAEPGVTVDASDLMIAVWGRDDPSNRNSLHGYIHKLRRALGQDPDISIINQRGFGYMLTVSRKTV